MINPSEIELHIRVHSPMYYKKQFKIPYQVFAKRNDSYLRIIHR